MSETLPPQEQLPEETGPVYVCEKHDAIVEEAEETPVPEV